MPDVHTCYIWNDFNELVVVLENRIWFSIIVGEYSLIIFQYRVQRRSPLLSNIMRNSCVKQTR